MEVKGPSPQTTLLILLGASKWPYSPEFQGSEAFARAARRVKDYFLHPQSFALPAENLLDLFDSEKSADEIDAAIGEFVEQRLVAMKATGDAGRDLLLYFIGHGGFARGNYEYYLAIRRTRAGNPLASGLQVASLAYTLKEQARHLRRILILDCCFAQSAFSFFQAGPDQVALRQTMDAFQAGSRTRGVPTRGTTLLSSSNQKTPSLLLSDFSSTMFTKAFMDVLTQGTSSQRERLTLRDVKEATWDLLSAMPDAPRPVVDSPDQSEGDVADIPFFPNPWFEKEQLRRAEVERLKKAEEERHHQAEETIVPPITTAESTPTPETFVLEATPTPEPLSTTEAASSPSTSPNVTSISSSAIPVVPLKPGISRRNKSLIIGLLLVLVLLFGSIGGVIYYTTNTINRATATAAINSSIAQTNARNIAQLNPALATANPDLYPPTHGKLTLYDPMHDNTNKGFGWGEGNGCTFTGTAYQVNSSYCNANNVELNNFAFEIEVDFTQQSSYQAASVFFRFISYSPRTFYVFSIYNDGTYNFEASATSLSGGNNIMPISTAAIKSDAIHQGAQKNIIAIVADGSNIDLYANHVKINSFTDDSSNYGGLFLSYENSPVNFRNAKLWTFT